MTYAGPLDAGKWISIVKDTINSNNPCVLGSDAAGAADAHHSGPLQPSGQYNGTRTIVIPQTAALLDIDARFAICYAEGDGSASDSTWRDSYIRMGVTKLYQVMSLQVTHTTWGQVDSRPQLPITLSGGLADDSTVSLVESTLNNGQPCESSSAAAAADSQHSGPVKSSSYQATLDTSSMDTASEYAVCYAEGTGTTADTSWSDSGIRLTLSRVSEIFYGLPQRSFTTVSSTTERRLPRADGVVFHYAGLLPGGNRFSLVRETLENNNPCMTASHAAHAADANHSGVVQSSLTKVVTISTSVLDVYADRKSVV